jgi:hypothetical protein
VFTIFVACAHSSLYYREALLVSLMSVTAALPVNILVAVLIERFFIVCVDLTHCACCVSLKEASVAQH